MNFRIDSNDIVVFLMAIQTLLQFYDIREKKERFIDTSQVTMNPT